MRFGYADPPYVGQAARHYAREAAADGRRAAEVNHPLLIAHLCDEFVDGWALSCSSPSLGYLLGLCPDDVRVAAWVKPFAVWKPGVNPGYCWEPVIFRGGRKRDRDADTVRDYLSEPVRLGPSSDGAQVPGAKPWRFCWWIFDLLGVENDDEVVDLFPGSGAVGRALVRYRERTGIDAARLFEIDDGTLEAAAP